ncbi:hypothetical protein F9C28_19325 [Shimwellia pseudoproteus]|uniref:hypothetical protein n=1 Tax=Shimwellia pseudoproteus TaxID=570012 RepID=UPI0018EBBEC6|nr:hypothetical protein [Shimwellia pseudoproteus]MBJ3816982.1 hypothetical protein [Shimwellia pseudoproteus]
MGWSVPEVPIKASPPAWSPWPCVLIIIMGLFISLIIVVLNSPADGLLPLTNRYWLPLAISTIAWILIAITIYLLWWEIQAVSVWNWNTWRDEMHQAWRHHAHQHLAIVHHVLITTDSRALARLAGVIKEEDGEISVLTILPDGPVTPGISRFEQLSRFLIAQITPFLFQRYPAGKLRIIIQTSGIDKNKELQMFIRNWGAESYPWQVDICLQNNELPFNDWNQKLSPGHIPVLILALHYRQSDEILPEFVCGLFLMPPLLLRSTEQKNVLRLFRAMPMNNHALAAELQELQSMVQLPSDKKYLVWYSGMATAPSQSLSRVLGELPISLYENIGTNGIIDYTGAYGGYGALAGWPMIAAAADMAAYGPENQWLLLEDKQDAWAIALGHNTAVSEHKPMVSLPPFPAGSILMAIILNMGLYYATIHSFPSLAFSWWGLCVLLLSLAVTLPGIALMLRYIIATLQRQRFIKAAQ